MNAANIHDIDYMALYKGSKAVQFAIIDFE